MLRYGRLFYFLKFIIHDVGLFVNSQQASVHPHHKRVHAQTCADILAVIVDSLNYYRQHGPEFLRVFFF